jgi:hypothetical protein
VKECGERACAIDCKVKVSRNRIETVQFCVWSTRSDLAEPVTQEELDNMAASYRAQTGHLTRAVKAANVLVVEAALPAPSRVFLEQLKRALATVWDQETKCAAICEDIRDAQDQTEANETHIEGCLTRDADQANAVGVAITREMARCEIGL